MDVNAGVIAYDTATIEDAGSGNFRLPLEMASGRKKAWVENRKRHNALVLCRTAPVT